jgi:uncharacterized membrane protein
MEIEKPSTEERLLVLEKKVEQLLHEMQKINPSPKQQTPISPPPIQPSPSAPEMPAQNYRVSSHASSNSSLNLLPLLAVICFAMAGVFIVKLAIESGWLNALRQWSLLTLLGLALCSCGVWLTRIEKNYRSYLASAGLIILYLSAHSGSTYFNIFDPIISLVLAAVVSLAGMYLLNLYQLERFSVIIATGTYLAPMFLDKSVDFILQSGFFLIWAAVFSRMSTFLNSRTLTLLGAYLGLGVFLHLNKTVDAQNALGVILVQSLQFIIYAFGVVYYSINRQAPLSKFEAMAYLPIMLFFYGTIYYLLNIYSTQLAPWISLGFCAFIYLLYLFAKKQLKKIESQDLVYSFLSVIIFHSGYVELLPDSAKVWMLPMIIVAKYISEIKVGNQLVPLSIKIMFAAIGAIEFFQLCFKLLVQSNSSQLPQAFATIAVGIFYYLKRSEDLKDNELIFLSLVHIICVLALYRLTYDYGSLAVSAAWGIYSIIILVYGYMKKNKIVTKSSTVVLAATCLKALVYDVSNAPSAIRILTLLFTGAILYGAGYLFQKINLWKE